MKRPRKQPITKHNSSFWEITLARICNRLQIRNTRERVSSDFDVRGRGNVRGTSVAELDCYT